MTYIGIDVSKDTLEVAFPSKEGYRNQTFGNTPKGIRSLIQKLSRDEHHCVMEATGNYSALSSTCFPGLASWQAWRTRSR